MVTYFSEICFKGSGCAGLSLIASVLMAWLSQQLNCCGLLFPFPLWLGGGCFWWMEENTHKVNSFFFLIGKYLWLKILLLGRCLWYGGQGWLSSQKAAFSGLTEHEFAAFFSGAGSLISSTVDLHRWPGGSDYITYERASLSDLWGSPKSRKESRLFCWSHHWWEGLPFCPYPSFFFSIT